MVLSYPSTNALCRIRTTKFPLTFHRCKSLTASIERGIQNSKSPRSEKRVLFAARSRNPLRRSTYSDHETHTQARRSPLTGRWTARGASGERSGEAHWEDKAKHSEKAWSSGLKQVERRHSRSFTGNAEYQKDAGSADQRRQRRQPYVPENLPYTTAASEFLYGYSVVQAAIKANRRKLYNLYIHTRGMENAGVEALTARAREARVKIHHVGDEYLRIMDKTSSGRPHNGFILESSPLPKPPITKLAEASKDSSTFHVELDKQSQEDLLVNGRHSEYKYKAAGWRYPLLLYVDGVLDEGNLGAIARSAYFLGVDAIATPARQSAPWSQIALKASAGGAEAVPIFTVNKPSEFLAESARSGWRIYASDAIASEQQLTDVTAPPGTRSSGQDFSSNIIFTYARSVRRIPSGHCPVEEHPTILMMGAEGSGLRPSLLNHAHYKVGIRAGRQTNEIGVDSLNVSVAASLLCFEFLKKPIKTSRTGGLLF